MRRFISRISPPPSSDGRGWKYVQNQTGWVGSSFDWDDLMRKITTHRASMGIAMPEGWKDVVEDEMTTYNECESFDPENPEPYRSELQKIGSKLWKELHSYRQKGDWSKIDADRWLSSWEQRIPNFSGCSCRDNYYELRSKLPPDTSTLDSFISWGIGIHNLVNEKLGKPIWIAD